MAVRLAWGSLSTATRMAAVAALFPPDYRATAGWIHTAGGEGWEEIAAWFGGSKERAADVARANGASSPATPPARGAVVRIPAEFLVPPFRDADPVPDEEPASLEYGEDARGRYALYRLRKGEALYSSVVVRFTGRLHAEDVIELALKIAERSGIEDVHAIPVGFPVRIALDELSEEYLPKDDPKSQALAREKAETAQFAPAPTAAGLAGVRVVLDAGHGGRDTGTIHGSAWESTYVYDVAARLRKVLLERTRAEVVMTAREPSVGFEPPDRDRLRDSKGRVLLTEPAYPLDDPVVGVNLRWYLANSILKRPGRDRRPIPPERTVFLSLHADSLHPSIRGAMAYVPGERFLRDSYGKTGAAYARYREWREEPTVSFSRRDRVAAEGVSTALAGRLLAAIRDASLPVHRFSPIRTHVIRGGREWVPAVLRYNRIPARVLLEISNLASEDDRELTMTRAFRQSMAEALADGLVRFFGGDAPAPRGSPSRAQAATPSEILRTSASASAPAPAPASLQGSPSPPAPVPAPARPATAAARGVSDPDADAEGRPAAADDADRGTVGPWPETYGPWPERMGPWPARAGPSLPRPTPAPARPPAPR